MGFPEGFPEELKELLNSEWLVCTGSGAFAASTASLANTRKQQGFFVAPTAGGFRRYVYVSRVEDELVRDEGNMSLNTCVYRDAVFPGGYRNMKDHSLHPFARFVFADSRSTVRKSVHPVPGENSIILRYGIETESPGSLRVRPVLGLRYLHSLNREREISLGIRPSRQGVFFRPGEDPVPPLIILASGGEYLSDYCWYRHFTYVHDRQKGESFEEDLPSPGYFLHPAPAGKSALFIIFTLEERWARFIEDQGVGVEKEMKKAIRKKGVHLSRGKLPHHFQKDFTPVEDSALSLLTTVEDRSFAVAGYPYYPVNVYDFILFLKDFLLRGGYVSAASKGIDFLSPYLKNGLLPKYISEEGEPIYCSADTSLLFVELIARYLSLAGGRTAVERKLALVGHIVDAYLEGTEFGTKMGEDYLLRSGRYGVEATWMDRMIGGNHLNRRYGAAVDTNALWYNALCIYRDLKMAVGDKKESQHISKMIPRIKSSFLKHFVLPDRGYLVDVIRDGENDARLRPNQLLALTLSNPLVSPTFGKRVLQKIKESLVTDCGLRTLAPGESGYAGQFGGIEAERLHALFGGCVLPHLALQYSDALLFVYGPKNRVVNRIRRFLLAQRRAAEKNVPYFLPEAFDGDPPHKPAGSPVSLAGTGAVIGLFRLYDSIVNGT
jgi:predicted glycogen debranching enzyme